MGEKMNSEDMKLLRKSMTLVVKKAIEDALHTSNEVWLSSRQLSEQFSMFNEQWLKEYGHLLPRTRAVVDRDGVLHEGKWSYPRNRIQQMIMSGEISNITYKER